MIIVRAYQKWEEDQDISPVSPEAYWAEQGWNAALRHVRAELSLVRNMEWEARLMDEFITDLDPP